MNQPHYWLAAIHPESGKPVLVRHGKPGYWDDPEGLAKSLLAEQSVEVTEAALAGSMFGWECRGAAAANEFVHQRMRAWRAEKLLAFVEHSLATRKEVSIKHCEGGIELGDESAGWACPTLEVLIDTLSEEK